MRPQRFDQFTRHRVSRQCATSVVHAAAQASTDRPDQPMPTVLADYPRKFVDGMDSDVLLFASKRAADGRLYQANAIFTRCATRADWAPASRRPPAPHGRDEGGSCGPGYGYNRRPRWLEDAADGRAVHACGEPRRSDGPGWEAAFRWHDYTGFTHPLPKTPLSH